MLFSWFRKIFSPGERSPRKAPTASRPQEPPGSEPIARAPPFDLGEIAEYDARQRQPLHPLDGQALGELSVQARQHFHASLTEGLPFPPLALRLIDLVGWGGCDINALVPLIHRDPVVSAEVLKAANAAIFGGLSQVGGIREAVMRLGAEEAGRVAVAAAVRPLYDLEARASYQRFTPHWRRLWQHAMAVAPAAGWLAMTCHRGDVQRAFLGGMLHDIGKTFALRSLSTLMLRGTIKGPLSEPLLELLLDALHVDMGVLVASEWKLPDYVRHICQGHHDSQVSHVTGGADDVLIVQLTSGLDELRTNPWHRCDLSEEVLRSAAELGMAGAGLRALVQQLRDAARQATGATVPVENIREPGRI